MDQLTYLKILKDASEGVELIQYEIPEDSEFIFKLEDELETYGYEVIEEEIKTIPSEKGPKVVATVLTWQKIEGENQ